MSFARTVSMAMLSTALKRTVSHVVVLTATIASNWRPLEKLCASTAMMDMEVHVDCCWDVCLCVVVRFGERMCYAWCC